MTLKLDNIGRSINNDWVVKDLSLRINNGQCLVLLGPSGCGKSTTLRIVAGLDKPTKGRIFIDDLDVTDVSPVNRNIGMVFQSYALYPHLNVIDNLSLGMKVRGVRNNQIQTKITNVLQLLQIDHLSNRKPNELSGGQKQRLALARALLRDPKIYLLDEPMSNLDAQLREDLRPELRNLILGGSQPVLYVTHDQQEALSLATKIAVMNEGMIKQIGTPKEIYEKPNSIFVASFVGRPKINLISKNNNTITGIRPENIYFDSTGLVCKLKFREWQGNYQLLSLNSEFGELRMLCSSKQEIPERIIVSWNKESEHDFNQINGQRIININ